VFVPVISGEDVGTPQADVPFRVPVPFRAWWHLCDLLRLLVGGISGGPAISDSYHRRQGANRSSKPLHHFSFLVLLLRDTEERYRAFVKRMNRTAAVVPKRRDYDFN